MVSCWGRPSNGLASLKDPFGSCRCWSRRPVSCRPEPSPNSHECGSWGLGELDLCAEVGIHPSADERELLPIRVQVVLASTAAGLPPPIGPVSTDFRDLDTLRHSTAALSRVGFGSRWAVHPAQVPVINQCSRLHLSNWRPRHLVERYDGALDQGVGVCVDEGGQMVDEAVVRAARRTLVRARFMAEKSGLRSG